MERDTSARGPRR